MSNLLGFDHSESILGHSGRKASCKMYQSQQKGEGRYALRLSSVTRMSLLIFVSGLLVLITVVGVYGTNA
jgi:hypothetical protein